MEIQKINSGKQRVIVHDAPARILRVIGGSLTVASAKTFGAASAAHGALIATTSKKNSPLSEFQRAPRRRIRS
jgi:hypothetical protein